MSINWSTVFSALAAAGALGSAYYANHAIADNQEFNRQQVAISNIQSRINSCTTFSQHHLRMWYEVDIPYYSMDDDKEHDAWNFVHGTLLKIENQTHDEDGNLYRDSSNWERGFKALAAGRALALCIADHPNDFAGLMDCVDAEVDKVDGYFVLDDMEGAGAQEPRNGAKNLVC